MDLKKAVRAHDWWEPKLSSILTVGYATVLVSGKDIIATGSWLIFLLGALLVGAIYVSVINDITDIDEDLASGKYNVFSRLPVTYRWIVPICCLLAGGIFSFFLFSDKISICLYLMCWVAFSLYSIPPVRLKKRGIWGVFADASGAHLFPTCFTVASTEYYLHQPINWVWFVVVGIWAFAWGLRGILGHQFSDRDNDIIAGVNTFAINIDPAAVKNTEFFLITIETIAFTVMLFIIKAVLPVVFLFLYFLITVTRNKAFKTKVVMFLKSGDERYVIFLNEYYQALFPLSLLLGAILYQHFLWIVLLAHILLFSKLYINLFNSFKNMLNLLF